MAGCDPNMQFRQEIFKLQYFDKRSPNQNIGQDVMGAVKSYLKRVWQRQQRKAAAAREKA
jgi:hypothetical protein